MCQFCNDDPNECVYASTCSVCHKKYFGNGYNNLELPCPACLKAQQAQTIKKSRWYLARRELDLGLKRQWIFNVLLFGFKTAAQAEAYATRFCPAYSAYHGHSVMERQVDEILGLVKINYISESSLRKAQK